MQITLDLPDSLTQTDTFNQSDWLREIAIALFQQKILLIEQAGHCDGCRRFLSNPR
jgi:predicted HTH domain antitoxin